MLNIIHLFSNKIDYVWYEIFNMKYRTKLSTQVNKKNPWKPFDLTTNTNRFKGDKISLILNFILVWINWTELLKQLLHNSWKTLQKQNLLLIIDLQELCIETLKLKIIFISLVNNSKTHYQNKVNNTRRAKLFEPCAKSRCILCKTFKLI